MTRDGRLYCAKCKEITVTDSHIMPDAMLGPYLLHMQMGRLRGGSVDSVMADYLDDIRNRSVSSNGTGNARRATVNALAGIASSIRGHP